MELWLKFARRLVAKLLYINSWQKHGKRLNLIKLVIDCAVDAKTKGNLPRLPQTEIDCLGL